MPRILIGSPVRQTPAVLERFLKSVAALRLNEGTEVDYVFVDDNLDNRSREMLFAFQAERGDGICLVYSAAQLTPPVAGGYARSEYTHLWDDASIWKVAAFKDHMIETAIEGGYDGLFIADSDLVLHAETLEKLISDDKPIVAMVFWTAWQPDTAPLPQVWLSDEYVLYERANGRETLSAEETSARTRAFLDMLRVPGVYPVGGLGACTLISREAMVKGARFARIDNLSLWGEDRHFCVRARALGLGLWADTHYPPTHLYRDSDLLTPPRCKRCGGDASVPRECPLSETGTFCQPEGVTPDDVRAPQFDPSVSRFIRKDDDRADEVVVPLPTPWWSRPYEYAWAQEFADPDCVVLDAACGISHPFKLWLANKAAVVHAIDIDPRITSEEAIIADIANDFGAGVADWVRRNELLSRIRFAQGAIQTLPYDDGLFDRIFCISVLEHMHPSMILTTLREFRRTLKWDGLVVLTFDVPTVAPKSIEALIQEAGFTFAGLFEPDAGPDALSTKMYGGLQCFRMVITPRKR